MALAFFVGAYFFAVWDSRKADAEEDGQIGLKIVLYTLAIGALGVAAGGVDTLVHYIFSGAKTGTPAIKSGAAGLVAGGLVLAGIVVALLPRTITQDRPKVLRMTLGFVAAMTGSFAIVFFGMFVSMMINGSGAPWAAKAQPLASFLTYGAIGFLALNKLGAMSGWVAPVRPMAPQGGIPQSSGYPPQQSGSVPQAGGYPPQGGGYPPQGGGMPPQGGGGYPPQGGSVPPQGGGYPPQGGGVPPQGGGYPPQGGGVPPQGGGGGYQPR